MNKRLIFAISVALNVALIGFGLLYVLSTREKFNDGYDDLDDRIVVVENKMEDLKKEVDDKVKIDENINSDTRELKDKVQTMDKQLSTLQDHYNKLRIYKEKLDEVFQIK